MQPENDPKAATAPFIDPDKQVADAAAALDGARAILVERFAEDADLIGMLREPIWSNGLMTSTVRDGKKTEDPWQGPCLPLSAQLDRPR
jgi:protein Tex